MIGDLKGALGRGVTFTVFLIWSLGKPCSASSLSRHQKCAGESSRAAQFERPETFVPVSFGNVWMLRLPFRQFKEIILGNLPLPGAFTKMGPLLSWKPIPLDLRH